MRPATSLQLVDVRPDRTAGARLFFDNGETMMVSVELLEDLEHCQILVNASFGVLFDLPRAVREGGWVAWVRDRLELAGPAGPAVQAPTGLRSVWSGLGRVLPRRG